MIRDLFGSRDVGELKVVDVEACFAEMNLPEGRRSASFSEVNDYLASISKASLAVHLKSGVVWAPPHADLLVTEGDRILILQHGYGALTDSAL